MIGDSYQPSATLHNSENIGLEPVWPYGVIGDSTIGERRQPDRAGRPDLQLPAEREHHDWSYDAVDAARLDMGSQVSSDLVANTEKYQAYISGLGDCPAVPRDEPYIEQSAERRDRDG